MSACHCIDAEVLATCPGCLTTFCEEHDAESLHPSPCRIGTPLCSDCIGPHETNCSRCRAAKRKKGVA